MNAIGLYRIEHWCYLKKIPIFPKLIHSLIFLLFNSHIPASCTIGKGTRFGYGAIGVVIHSNAIIGKNCIIGTNVTIGDEGQVYLLLEIMFIFLLEQKFLDQSI